MKSRYPRCEPPAAGIKKHTRTTQVCTAMRWMKKQNEGRRNQETRVKRTWILPPYLLRQGAGTDDSRGRSSERAFVEVSGRRRRRQGSNQARAGAETTRPTKRGPAGPGEIRDMEGGHAVWTEVCKRRDETRRDEAGALQVGNYEEGRKDEAERLTSWLRCVAATKQASKKGRSKPRACHAMRGRQGKATTRAQRGGAEGRKRSGHTYNKSKSIDRSMLVNGVLLSYQLLPWLVLSEFCHGYAWIGC